MGAPVSSIFSEIYLTYIEKRIIANILLKYRIVGYIRYVDCILILYIEDRTNIHDVFNIYTCLLHGAESILRS